MSLQLKEGTIDPYGTTLRKLSDRNTFSAHQEFKSRKTETLCQVSARWKGRGNWAAAWTLGRSFVLPSRLGSLKVSSVRCITHDLSSWRQGVYYSSPVHTAARRSLGDFTGIENWRFSGVRTRWAKINRAERPIAFRTPGYLSGRYRNAYRARCKDGVKIESCSSLVEPLSHQHHVRNGVKNEASRTFEGKARVHFLHLLIFTTRTQRLDEASGSAGQKHARSANPSRIPPEQRTSVHPFTSSHWMHGVPLHRIMELSIWTAVGKRVDFEGMNKMATSWLNWGMDKYSFNSLVGYELYAEARSGITIELWQYESGLVTEKERICIT